jgi:hypothetical protein
MKRGLYILLGALLITGCYKDEIDLESLNNNPFDRDYQGPAVFVSQGTFMETVTIVYPPPVQVQMQVIEFRVREELFLADNVAYSVQVVDQENGTTHLLNPDPPGSDKFKYYRSPVPGVPVCVELRLANNQSTAGAETICETL